MRESLHIFIRFWLFLDSNNGFAPRFIGFSVYVSNTTEKSEGVLCFKDNNYTLNSIPDVLSTTCFVHGQYVIYFNQYKTGERFNNFQKTWHAFNELCELEVFGKKNRIFTFSITFKWIIFLSMKTWICDIKNVFLRMS